MSWLLHEESSRKTSESNQANTSSGGPSPKAAQDDNSYRLSFCKREHAENRQHRAIQQCERAKQAIQLRKWAARSHALRKRGGALEQTGSQPSGWLHQ